MAKPHGTGTEFDENGKKMYEGQWQHGKRHGNGSEYYPYGIQGFEGEFEHGETMVIFSRV